METKVPVPRPINVFTEPQRIQPGCKHMLACRCDIPFHLRPPTKEEEEHWFWHWGRTKP